MASSSSSLLVEMSCISCDLQFAAGDLNAFVDHMTEAHYQDAIQCTSCGERFSTGVEYAMHFIYAHTPTTGETCNTATAATTSNSSNSASSSSKTREKAAEYAYECPHCPFKAAAPEMLASHFEQNHEDDDSSPPSSSDLRLQQRRTQTTTIFQQQQQQNGEEGASCSAAAESTTTSCPVCSEYFPLPALNDHVNSHFEQDVVNNDYQLALELDRRERKERDEAEKSELEVLRKEYGMDESGSYNEQGLQALNRAYGKGQITIGQLYDAKLRLRMNQNDGVEDAGYCVKNPVAKIRELSRRGADVLDVHLCTAVDHYSTSQADFGFGCGYRNIQMLLSSLKHCEMYKKALWGDGPVHTPSVPKVQELIECAWREGFDSRGCAQLNGRLRNTRKWIGATEAAVFLQSFRIKVQLVDVTCSTGPKSTHPQMLRWCYEYFKEGASRGAGAFVPPLYLQHQGHSRTIIGVERNRSGQFRLLVFDPSHSRQRMQQFNSSSSSHSPSLMLNGYAKGADLKLLRKTPSDLTNPKYQLVVVRGLMESDQEYQWYKTNFDYIKIPPTTTDSG